MSDDTKIAPLFLNRDALRKEFGIELSNTHLLRLEARDLFPRRIYLTAHRVVWDRVEIEEWIDERKSERAHRIYPIDFLLEGATS